jgi:hypothetical protein
MSVLICICSAGTNSVLLGSMKTRPGMQKCNTCPKEEKWSKMQSWKIVDAADTEDSAWHWAYKCVTCVKEAQKFDTDGEAWAYILEVSGTAARKQAKVNRFQAARTEVKKTFTAMGVAKKGRELYQLTRKSLMTVFEDIFDLIQLKVRALVILADTLETHADLREELARTTDIERIKEIVELIAEENEKNHAMFAFKDPDTGKTKWDVLTFSNA